MHSRRWLLEALGAVGTAGAVAACSTTRGGASRPPAGWEPEALALLERAPAVDLHAHPGRFFLKGGAPLHASLAPLMSDFAERIIADMRSGHVSAACFAIVGDLLSLRAERTGELKASSAFEPGTLYGDYIRQVRTFRDLAESGLLLPVLLPEHIPQANRAGKVGGILTCEGADFLEGRLERLEEAQRDGVRSITIVHYRPSEAGDIQTEAPAHGGLTDFGERMIREMNRLHLIVDLAHASKATVRRACEITMRPVMLSHSNLTREDNRHPRLIDAEHARLIADTGGVVGAWPAGIGLADFDGYVDEILRLVDLLGVDHVGIGTDMDANLRPVFTNYRDFPKIPAALLERGLHRREVRRIIGGNFLRLFKAVSR